MNIEEALKNCPLFKDLSKNYISQILKICKHQKIDAGSTLFFEGDNADALFILIKGSVELIKSSPQGKEQLIRTVKPPEIFAEAAMLSGIDYPVTAITKQRSELLKLAKEDLLTEIKRSPQISLAMMGTMANLLRHLNGLIYELTLGSVKKRLARYLLNLSERTESNKFVLPLKKQELAFQLGTISETLSRNLKSLKSQGVIAESKSEILVLSREKLKKIADLT